MRLNTVKPGPGAGRARKRLGRGIGSGTGKTAGRGHKGQRARAGGFHKVGFEGGQMPLQRRLPKVGFRSRLMRITAAVRLDQLERAGGDIVDLELLKKANIVGKKIKNVKVFAAGKIGRSVTVKGLRVSKGARAAIEAAGGKVES